MNISNRSFYKTNDKNNVITCDMCQKLFDVEERVPTILPDCGHTLCAVCVQEILERDSAAEHKCFICMEPIDGGHVAEDFRAN
jgi:hypothetical protein